MMMRLTFIFVLFFFASSSDAQQTRGIDEERVQQIFESFYTKTWAVIIGIDEYPNLRANKQLSYAVSDAQGVANVLRTQFDFDEVITRYNAEATRDGIMDILRRQLRQTGENDGVFVFFAGHGITEDARFGELGYLVPHDGSNDPGDPRNISMSVIKNDIATAIPAKHVFFVMDACYGGLLLQTRAARDEAPTVDRAYLETITRDPVRQVLAAGGKDQEVLDGGRNGHSVFTSHLLDALENAPGYITAREVGYRLPEQVWRDARDRGQNPPQRPQFGNLMGEGDFVFLKKDRAIRTARATVRVSVNVDANLSIDGNASGALKADQSITLDLTSGTHTILVDAPGYQSVSQTVTVASDEQKNIHVTLSPSGQAVVENPINPPISGNGSLYIRSEPEGATIEIDGRQVDETPATVRDLRVGPHRVRVTLPMYHPWEEMVDVTPDVKWLEPIQLRPAFGLLRIASEPPDALLYLDGRQVGNTPFARERFASGSYSARLVLDWYHDWEGTISVVDGDGFDDCIVLRPAFGSLTLSSVPSGARVYVNGEDQGTTPLTIERMRSGAHTVRVEKDLYASWSEDITISDGQSTRLRADLDARFGALTVTSQPADMPVHINGESKGRTPLTLNAIGVGTHRVTIGKGVEGYHPYEGTVDIQVSGTANVSQTLLPRLGHLSVFSEPAEGVVYINGEEKGRTPITVRGLLAGTHKVEIKKDGMVWEGEVLIKEGEEYKLTCELITSYKGSKMFSVSPSRNPLKRIFWRYSEFHIDRRGVTNEEFAAFMTAQKIRSQKNKSRVGSKYTGINIRKEDHWHAPFIYIAKPGYEKEPVTNVSFKEAQAYCEWANKRLPSYDEWNRGCQDSIEGTMIIDENVWEWTTSKKNIYLKPTDWDYTGIPSRDLRERAPILAGGTTRNNSHKQKCDRRALSKNIAENKIGFRCVR